MDHPGLSRRAFFASTAAGAAVWGSDAASIKIAHAIPAEASDGFLEFCRQIGLVWARLNISGDPSLDRLRAIQKRFLSFGIRIYGASHFAYRSLRIQLGQPGRDKDIDIYRTFLRNAGRLGITVAAYDFHPANTYTTATIRHRGYPAREFDERVFRRSIERLVLDREYSADEIWEYYTYFIRAALPAAEESGVFLALHPDDPPLAIMNGVAKLFVDYAGYRKAEEAAGGSPHWGVRFCIGTWAAGGSGMGKDIFEMIRHFGSRKRLFDVDFRNISSPLPVFHETLPDDGYIDMSSVMKALLDAGYTGGLVPDHVPLLEGDGPDKRAGLAYCIAYHKSLLARARGEAP